VESLYRQMMTDVARQNPDVVLIEIADGVYQRETQILLDSDLVRSTAAGVVLTAACAASAISIDQAVKQSGWNPIAMTGLTAMCNADLQYRQRDRCDLSTDHESCSISIARSGVDTGTIVVTTKQWAT